MANEPDIGDVLSAADRPLDLFLMDDRGGRMSATVTTTFGALWGHGRGGEIRFTATEVGTPKVVGWRDGETFAWQDGLRPVVPGDEVSFSLGLS